MNTSLRLRRWLRRLAAALAFWALASHYGVSITWMSSDSMAPALDSEGGTPDFVLLDRLTHRLREPQRGELVLFQLEGDWVIKRVVGLPGETVAIRQGRVWADGKPVLSPPDIAAVSYRPGGHLAAGMGFHIRPGHFLVLGDNSGDSWDSRYWGCLARARIEGIARAVLWPPSRAAAL